MLQNTEYRVGPYLKWYWQTSNFSKVMYRRRLEPTRAARLLLATVRVGILLELGIGVASIVAWWQGDLKGGLAFGLAIILAYPVVWAHLVIVPLGLGWLVTKPLEWRQIRASHQIFANFGGIKIAVAGSYGKTSMKELLLTVLGQGRKVAATPANKNVAISHARFAKELSGNEDILIIEFGEGGPGDVARFAQNTHPTHGIITGLSPAHLDKYKTLQRAGEDIFSLANYVPPKQLYVNAESQAATPFIKSTYQAYNQKGVLGWKIDGVRINLDGTKFVMRKDKQILELHSGLVGRHQVGPLALAAALAYQFGLSAKQIAIGIAKTEPFEHRMQPYKLHGAWIIDDTYNGNLEGVRVGIELLHELPGRRKIYVTPGLVDQGKDSDKIHEQMGRLIAKASPDIVVLMQHSVTKHIQKGLDIGHYKGQLLIQDDPLAFYNNLPVFVANGDLVLMQNDWPDSYR